MLYLVCVILLIFSFLHFFVFANGQQNIALVDFLCALGMLVAILDLRRSGNIDRAAFIGSISLIVLLLAFVQLNQNNSFGLIWVIFLPIFAIWVNGSKLGLQITITFYLILFVMAYQGIGVWQNGEWDSTSLFRLIISSIILTIIIYSNEVSITKAKEKERDARNELEKLSCLDELTQIANRREINNILSKEINRAKRYGHKLSFILFDIDDFKQINDVYGHISGDHVLQKISEIVKSNIRQTDNPGRWGGEEFCLILPEEDLQSGQRLAEKLRKIIEISKFDSIPNSITCSFGIAEWNEKTPSVDDLINNADKALYRAKRLGKNRVVNYKPEQSFIIESNELVL
ncbi:GGDEF domain-containing protein [Thiomicrorhabdus sp. ZW0627]|nr:GGDEF domain-containing protein [Thiomicrorhabdus sp. ZW0627]MDG6773038.1 GGDEF domain-containing protein [Thiomicrorhabdus sp. ZW0627]